MIAKLECSVDEICSRGEDRVEKRLEKGIAFWEAIAPGFLDSLVAITKRAEEFKFCIDPSSFDIVTNIPKYNNPRDAYSAPREWPDRDTCIYFSGNSSVASNGECLYLEAGDYCTYSFKTQGNAIEELVDRLKGGSVYSAPFPESYPYREGIKKFCAGVPLDS